MARSFISRHSTLMSRTAHYRNHLPNPIIWALLTSLVVCDQAVRPKTLVVEEPSKQSSLAAAIPDIVLDTVAFRPLQGLNVAIVGAGPSGLLLAHLLAKQGASLDVYERRSRPVSKQTLDPRAYALGIGRRGRTAIQSVDMDLWRTIKQEGFGSERFQLHVGPLVLTLRSARDSRGLEPSLLLFQTDLCRVLGHELERRFSANQVRLHYDAKVTDLNLAEKQLSVEGSPTAVAFDVVFGCDGVNSVVRYAMDQAWPEFECETELIPGLFKVVRLDQMPLPLDPTAVALVLPKRGSVTAFVEPTAGRSCCVLFLGSNEADVVLSSCNATEVQEELEQRFPKLRGVYTQAAAQLAQMNATTQGSLVKCNTYSYASVAALVGDAAHSTGGVSGQGVNSALVDSVALADSLSTGYQKDSAKSLRQALLAYSERQVPEGKALYDLSFGPNPKSLRKKAALAFRTIRDSIFKGHFGIGELPLRNKLTTSLESFADIRRRRDYFYEAAFPDQTTFSRTLEELDATILDEMNVG